MSINKSFADFPFLIVVLFLGLFLFSACQRMVNYPDPKSPVYISHQKRSTSPEQTLDLVSFNIEHSKNIREAIQELKSHEKFSDPEIILLQEMDLKGVQHIAEAFNLNYLYYPSVIQEKQFGNAILSRSEIRQERKTILSAIQKNNRLRNATNAVLEFNEKEILVYSIHNSTITMPFKKRKDQIDAIIASIPDTAQHIIIGGDFNTLGKRYKKYVYQSFEAAGFINATAEIKHTSKYFFNLVKIKNDHIFTKNLRPIESNVLKESKASDHQPIFLKFDFESNSSQN